MSATIEFNQPVEFVSYTNFNRVGEGARIRVLLNTNGSNITSESLNIGGESPDDPRFQSVDLTLFNSGNPEFKLEWCEFTIDNVGEFIGFELSVYEEDKDKKRTRKGKHKNIYIDPIGSGIGKEA